MEAVWDARRTFGHTLRPASLGPVRSVGRERRSERRRPRGDASLVVSMLTDALLSDVTGPLVERAEEIASQPSPCTGVFFDGTARTAGSVGRGGHQGMGRGAVKKCRAAVLFDNSAEGRLPSHGETARSRNWVRLARGSCPQKRAEDDRTNLPSEVGFVLASARCRVSKGGSGVLRLRTGRSTRRRCIRGSPRCHAG